MIHVLHIVRRQAAHVRHTAHRRGLMDRGILVAFIGVHVTPVMMPVSRIAVVVLAVHNGAFGRMLHAHTGIIIQPFHFIAQGHIPAFFQQQGITVEQFGNGTEFIPGGIGIGRTSTNPFITNGAAGWRQIERYLCQHLV